MAVKNRTGAWQTLAGGLTPEFHVASGRCRISEQQLWPLRDLGRGLTPEREKWKVFWDAPLNVPGVEGINPALPRDTTAVQRATPNMLAEGDTHTKFPDDEIYGELVDNYVKVNPLPRFDEGWISITDALRAGRKRSVTIGEVLIRGFALTGDSPHRSAVVDLEWTFPLDFVELVWGDGQTTSRQIIPATEHPPFGGHRFTIPFDASGKKWIRFAA